MDDTWVLVADGHQARLFKTDAELMDLTAVKDWKNAHHAAEHRRGGSNPDSKHDAEEDGFARELANHLDHADRANEYRTLVLVSPPRFLGFVRNHLGTGTAARVGATLAKDIAGEEVHALAKHLRKLLADRHLEDARP
jgi:protein required for attachment to host cells